MCNNYLLLTAGLQNRTEPNVNEDHQMKNERDRLKSFSSYQVPNDVWLSRLAETGFYLSHADTQKLRCAFCKVTADFNCFRGRSTAEVHRELSPDCSFIQNENVQNTKLTDLGLSSGMHFIQSFLERESKQSTCADEPSQWSELKPPESSERYHHPALDFGHSSSELHRDPWPQPSCSINFGESGTPSDLQTDGQTRESSIPSPAMQAPSISQSESQTAVTNPPHRDTEPYQTPRFIEQQPQTSSETFQTAWNARDPEIQSTESNSSQQQTPLHSETATASTREAAEIAEQVNNTPTQQPPSSAGTETRVVTYAQLGIITARPKRPDLAVTSTRINTFKNNWPHAGTHSPEKMAEAGFYFTGRGDLVRCFYCKHGLKSWSEQLDPWVEHARWFPDCPFVLQVKGDNYIAATQALHKEKENISPSELEEEIRKKRTRTQANTLSTNNGNKVEIVDEAQCLVMDDGRQVSGTVTGSVDATTIVHLEQDLKKENEDILRETICKICQTNEVNILFLPCGHLVSCAHCAPALRNCAICRQLVKGIVRVYGLDDR